MGMLLRLWFHCWRNTIRFAVVNGGLQSRFVVARDAGAVRCDGATSRH